MAGQAIRGAAAILFLATAASSGAAQQWVAGLGWSDYSYSRSRDSLIGSFEYHADPFYFGDRARLGWALSAELTGQGDAFIGAGVAMTYDLGPGWVIEGSLMPGAFFNNPGLNDLGSTFQFRSLLGLGYRLPNGTVVSLAVSHKSNGGLTDFNPGVNSIFLRWQWGL